MRFYIFLVIASISLSEIKASDFAEVNRVDSLSIMQSNSYLVNDKNGNIWIGYKYPIDNSYKVPKLAKWDGFNLKIYSQSDGLEFGVVRNFLATEDGNVWLATNNGLNHLKNGETIEYMLPQNEEGFRVISEYGASNIVEDDKGNIWCKTQLYNQKDIYNNKEFAISGQEQIWKLENGTWTHIEEIDIRNIAEARINKGINNTITLTGWASSLSEVSLPKLININDNSLSDFSTENFTRGKIVTITNNIFANNNEYILSFRPDNMNHIFEGFSIYNTASNDWRHFGASPFKTYEGFNKDFVAIPSAVREDSGVLFNEINWVATVTKAKDGGLWLGMQYDHKAPWLLQNGGGLLYFDGKDNFIRYSTDTHDEIEPLRFDDSFVRNTDESKKEEIQLSYTTGVAYDKNGDLWLGSLDGGIWVIPKEILPDNINSVERSSENEAIMLLPNVVSSGETITISLVDKSISKINEVTITNSLGEMISSLNSEHLSGLGNQILKTTNYSSGVYFVNILTENKKFTKKFIVIK